MALIRHWPLNGNLDDVSGNGYNLFNSGAEISPNGKIGQTYNFSGQYMQTETIQKTNGQEISVAVWFKQTATGGYQQLVANRHTNESYNWLLYFHAADNSIQFHGLEQYKSSVIPTLNQWNHVAATVNAERICRVYLNGQLVHTVVNFQFGPAGSPYIHIAASYSGAEHYFGQMNDIRIYDHALSAMDIQELARAKMLHYTFDDMQEPTTNLATSIEPVFNSWGNMTGTTNHITLLNGKQAVYMNSTYVDGGVRWRITNNDTLISVTPSTYYTMSAKIKYINAPHPNMFYLRQFRSDGSQITEYGVYDLNNSVELSYHWYFVYGTVNLHPECVNVRLESYEYSTNQIWMYDFQFEKKSYPTEFTMGTRIGQVKDYSGFFNHSINLTETTTPRWVSDAKIGTGAYYFNGSGSPVNIIDVDKSFGAAQEAYTIAFWAKNINGGTGNMPIADRINSNFYWYGDNSWRYVHGASGEFYYPKSVSIPAGTWGHFCVTYDGAYVKIYRNGVFEGQQASTGPANFSNGFKIGNWVPDATYQYHGNIDDVRIYATALSALDVKDLYETRAEIESTGVLYTKNLTPKYNYLNPYEFFKYVNNGTTPNLQIYHDRYVWVVYPHAFYPGNAFTGMFKSNTSYKIHIVFSHNTFYDAGGHYVHGGFVVRYTDGSEDYLIYLPTNAVEWHTSDLITSNTKTILYIHVYYHSSYPIHIDTESYIIEHSDDEVDATGIAKFRDFSTVGVTENLIGYWPFNGNTKDYSGNKYHGVANGVILNRNFVRFDAQVDHINFHNNGLIIPLEKTLIFSIRSNRGLSATDNWQIGFVDNSFGLGYMFGMMYGVGECQDLGFWGYGVEYDASIESPTNKWSSDGNWHHVALTMNSLRQVRIYIDGVAKQLLLHSDYSTLTDYITMPANTANYFMVGSRGVWDTMTYVDLGPIKLFNRALSLQEIAIEYNTMFKSEAQMDNSGVLHSKDLVQY